MRWSILVLACAAGCTILFEPTEPAPEGDGAVAPSSDGGGPDGEVPNEGFTPLCPASMIVAHWDFEGVLTSGVRDVAGSHDGVVVTSPPAGTEGRYGQAGLFRRADEGFVKVDDDPALDLALGSIEVWVRYDIDAQEMQVVARDAKDSGTGHFWIRRRVDDHVSVRLQQYAPQPDVDQVTLVSNAPIPKDEWHQIVVNFGCPLGECGAELYIDRVLHHGVDTEKEYSLDGNENPFVFGTDQGNAPEGSMTSSPTEYLEGAIDEIVLCSVWVAPDEG